jgi:serine protease Do
MTAAKRGGERGRARNAVRATIFVALASICAGGADAASAAVTDDATAATVAAVASPSAGSAQIVLPNFASLAKRYGPAVVNISVTHEVTQMGVQLPPGIAPGNPLAPFLARRVIGNREEVSLGSGFIVSADGYILTNRHVVGDASVVDVKLTDKREFKGKVVGTDALADVALIKIDADDLPVVVTGNPQRIEVGDWVMAIGSPYGFANTVTSGIVSAKSRSLPGEAYVPFIQTDVPINPGNSGGPLFDLRGRVVAINSMIFSKTGGYQGLSFAIPIDVALDVKDQLLKTGHVSRGWLGVNLQEVSQALARSFGLEKPDGALISVVDPRGPAAKAGMQAGDVVLAVDGHDVDDSVDLLTTVAKIRPGQKADLLVWRAGHATHMTVAVGELDSNSGASTNASAAPPTRLGIVVRPLSIAEQQRLGLDHGLLIEQVAGRATRIGLKPGDIVLSVNGTPVASLDQLADELRQLHDNAALLIQRGTTRVYLPFDPA